jgi:hypothetical protein
MIFIKNFKQEHGEGIKTKMKNKRRQGGKKRPSPADSLAKLEQIRGGCT